MVGVGHIFVWVAWVAWVHEIFAWVKKRREWRGSKFWRGQNASQVFCFVIKSFTKFTGKHLCWSLLLNKVQAEDLQIYLKRRLQHRCFLVNFAKFLRIPN